MSFSVSCCLSYRREIQFSYMNSATFPLANSHKNNIIKTLCGRTFNTFFSKTSLVQQTLCRSLWTRYSDAFVMKRIKTCRFVEPGEITILPSLAASSISFNLQIPFLPSNRLARDFKFIICQTCNSPSLH